MSDHTTNADAEDAVGVFAMNIRRSNTEIVCGVDIRRNPRDMACGHVE